MRKTKESGEESIIEIKETEESQRKKRKMMLSYLFLAHFLSGEETIIHCQVNKAMGALNCQYFIACRANIVNPH